MFITKHFFVALIAFLLTEASSASILNPDKPQTASADQTMSIPDLPEGRWTGTITSRTIPDMEQEGEFLSDIALENCSGNAAIRFRLDSGEYATSISLEQFALPRTYLLMSSATENTDGSGWS